MLNGYLAANHSVADAAYGTGLSGTGRLHDLFVNIEGMTPGEYRNGGEALSIQYSIQAGRFGKYIVASTVKGICNLAFFDGDDASGIEALHQYWPHAKLVQGTDESQQQVISFFSSDKIYTSRIMLHLRATPFQLKVWQALLHIPEGNISTYGAVARQLRQEGASRAVGTAIGSNPVGYIIPCHRVIKSIGETGGYRWGGIRKKPCWAGKPVEFSQFLCKNEGLKPCYNPGAHVLYIY